MTVPRFLQSEDIPGRPRDQIKIIREFPKRWPLFTAAPHFEEACFIGESLDIAGLKGYKFRFISLVNIGMWTFAFASPNQSQKRG
jgi:hypothetical protein